jgi:hypothetical protein
VTNRNNLSPRICLGISIYLCAALVVSAQSLPHGWRGIVPLRSTRADVVRLLGPPNTEGGQYEWKHTTIVIDYSDGPCETGRSGWNVPRDTVVRISMAPTEDLRFADLHIDEKKYKRSEDGELPGIFYYTNDAEGITISGSQVEVRNIYYNPTSSDDHLRCSCSTLSPSNWK